MRSEPLVGWPKAGDSEGANLGDILLCPPENSIEDRVRPHPL